MEEGDKKKVKNVETSTLLSNLIEIGWLVSKVIEESDAHTERS